MDIATLPLTAPAAIHPLTRGPRRHWFGYYDKLQTDPSDRRVLGQAVDFEGRTPRPDDEIEIGLVDRNDHDRWIKLGTSRAWCWQQGCMLQWRPGSASQVLWNDREDHGGKTSRESRFVCRCLNVDTSELTTLPRPIYHLSPDGRRALGLDFARVQDCRPGYGYVGVPDPHRDEPAPRGSGLSVMDLDTGAHRMLFSIADVAALPYADPVPDERHWFNHVQWSPDSRRFVFLHRWRAPGQAGWRTRMLTASADGDDLAGCEVRLVTDAPGVSHFEWRDAQHLVYHRDGAYRCCPDDGSGDETLLWVAPDGHLSHLPATVWGPDWLVTDTYPLGPERRQRLYRYHLPSGTAVMLADLPAPPAYTGEWRCDLHPRLTRDGRAVIVDSAHGAAGRQLYWVDLAPTR